MRSRTLIGLYAASMLLASCGMQPIVPSEKHVQREAVAAPIPQPLKYSVVLPQPRQTIKLETYSIVVANVPAQEILFALTRDAKINLDIHPGIQGMVTLNALNQTLPQILSRIARQIDIRYELENGNLTVMPDTPYLHNYKIDYVNMTRDMDGTLSNATQVGSGAAAGAGNNSSLGIRNNSRNHFWETLIQNIKDILHETDKILPEGSSETVIQQQSASSSSGTGVQPSSSKKSYAKSGIENSPNPVNVQEGGTTVTRLNTFREAASVIANPENALITVRATGKQHEKIQEFVDQVMSNARRQVMIEATLLEVRLSDAYKQGINWSVLQRGGSGFQLQQAGTAGLQSENAANMFTLNYLNATSSLGNLAAQVALLESFGKVKVLSSPKLSVMNNQTAILRVVDNLVYFTVGVKIDSASSNGPASTTYTTTLNTTPVGFTMSVTPQINDSDTVLLNVRPSITRLIAYVNDPNPDLAKANVTSRIPQIQIREIESVLKIENNQIAVMGGLMQDETSNLSDGIPGFSDIPLLGALFKNRNDTISKSELVIFLRPVIIKDASIEGDFRHWESMLPEQNFFK